MNLSLGGSSGNSGGKDNRALKKPPSLYNAGDLSTIVSIRSNKCNVLQGIRGSKDEGQWQTHGLNDVLRTQ